MSIQPRATTRIRPSRHCHGGHRLTPVQGSDRGDTGGGAGSVAEGGVALSRRGDDAACHARRVGESPRHRAADRRSDRAVPVRLARRVPPRVLARAVDAHDPRRLGPAGVRERGRRRRPRLDPSGVVLHACPPPRRRPGSGGHRGRPRRGVRRGRGGDRGDVPVDRRHGSRLRTGGRAASWSSGWPSCAVPAPPASSG